MSKRFVAVLVATLAGAFGVVFASPAGATRAVIVRPGQSIQAAVDAAAPGSTIIVQRGTYPGNVTITTDGIKLLGFGATVVPGPNPQPDACSFGGPPTDGICAIGEIDFSDPDQPVVSRPVHNVTISGFTVKGFPGSGVIYLGSVNPVVTSVQAIGNGEYGIARFESTGGKLIGNRATGSEEAGIYVGDSPNADVLIAGNEVSGSLFGFFLRDSAHGKVVGNRAHDNCLGLINLNTGSNEAGDYWIAGNVFTHNDKFCPENVEENTPALSGIGVAIAGGHGNTVVGNTITNNVPGGDAQLSGGVVVVASDPGVDPPANNVVKGNVITGNQPDIFTDGSGTGNVFRHNRCATSDPAGLC